MLDALPSESVMGYKRTLKKIGRELKQIKRDNGKAKVTYLANRYEGVPSVADEDQEQIEGDWSGMNLPSVPCFTGNNFNLWSIKMQTILHYNSLEYWIMKGFDDPYDDAKDALALYLIQKALDDKIFHVVTAENTTK